MTGWGIFLLCHYWKMQLVECNYHNKIIGHISLFALQKKGFDALKWHSNGPVSFSSDSLGKR